MRLYLDEDISSRHLTQALRKDAHDVVTPQEAGLMGESDVVQLIHAVRDNRVVITRNSGDFENLHNLILLCGGSHPGIFTVRADNDRRRDLKPGHIVTAIGNLTNVVASVRDHVICLNEWR